MENSVQMKSKPHLFTREVPAANIVLAVQFLLGMYINLYVSFPSGGPAEAWNYAWKTPVVAAHIILGTLALLAGISTLVRSIRMKNRHWILFAGMATAAMLLSVIAGETFITMQSELASYLMAFGFLAGLMALDWGFFTQ
jgi:uncharacterized membrane protein YozB (DUF420 family)